MIVSCGYEKQVKLWDIKSGKIINSFDTTGNNKVLCWTKNYITAGNKHNQLTTFDIRSQKKMNKFSMENNIEIENVVSSEGRGCLFLATSFENITTEPVINSKGEETNSGLFKFYKSIGQIRVLDLNTFQVTKTINSHTSRCRSVCLSNNERYLYSSGDDSLITMFETNSFICEKTFTTGNDNFDTLAVDRTNQIIAYTGNYSPIYFDNIKTAENDFIMQVSDVKSMKFHPTLDLFACSLGSKRTSKMIDLRIFKV